MFTKISCEKGESWSEKNRKEERQNFHQGGAASCFLSSYNTITQIFLLFLFLLWHLSRCSYQKRKITEPSTLKYPLREEAGAFGEETSLETMMDEEKRLNYQQKISFSLYFSTYIFHPRLLTRFRPQDMFNRHFEKTQWMKTVISRGIQSDESYQIWV